MNTKHLSFRCRVLAVAVIATLMPLASVAAPVTGGVTTVTLDSGTVTALTGLGFSIAPISPSTVGGTPLAAAFPITGGDTTTAITHSGGLTFTRSSTSASISNFIINLSGPQANVITGTLLAGSTSQSGVRLFDIGSGLSLTLDAQLGAGLSTVFEIPNLSGAAIGTATVSPNAAVPEPTSMALVGAGILASFATFRRNKNRTGAV